MSQAPDLQTGFNRDYVAFMRCDAGEGWLPDAEAQVASWLREKGIDLPVDRDGDLVEDDRRVSVRRHHHGRAHDLRLSIVERTPRAGTFTTELLAHDEPGEADWVHLTVRNDRGSFVDVPRIAKYLMQVLPLGDGPLRFSAKPQVLRSDDVDGLVRALIDPKRHSLVFVAGTDQLTDIPVTRFATEIGKWMRQVYGIAQVVVLDPKATQAFASRMGEAFQAHPWTIRTYRPAVDLGSWMDSRRHRILGTASLTSRSEANIRSLFGDLARNHAGVRPVPTTVQQVRRRFERLENRKLVEALDMPVESRILPAPAVETPGASDSATEVATGIQTASEPGLVARFRDEVVQLGLVRTILGLKEVTETGLRDVAARLARAASLGEQSQLLQGRLEDLQSRLEVLEDERDHAVAAVREEQLALEIAELDVEKRDDRIRWLEARLAEHNDYETAFAQVPEEFASRHPETYEDLLEQIGNIPGLVFTGNTDVVLRLATIDTNETALRVAWDAVLTLADYVRARGCGDWDSGLEQFIAETPAGYRAFPPGKFAASETGTTMKSFGKERVFPVPDDVDSAAELEMKAHFKLARIGMKSPRMHVYDAHPHQPLVCIGYIGPHLTNTQT